MRRTQRIEVRNHGSVQILCPRTAHPNIGHNLDQLLLRERLQAPVHDGLVELRLRLDVLHPDTRA